MLLMNPSRVVSTERLIDGLWAEAPPEGAVNTVHAHVSHLRRSLGGAVAIVTQPPGYILPVQRDQVDLLRFEDFVTAARNIPREGPIDVPNTERAVGLLDEALALWRGTALDDLGGGEFADNARSFLEERRLGVSEDRMDLWLILRRYRDVVEACEELLRTHPLRETLWEKLLIALYRSGRQADALARYRDCRDVLIKELGVEPMPRLQLLEQQILNHDDALARGRPGSTVVPRAARTASGTITVLRPRLQASLIIDGAGPVVLAERLIVGRHPSCDIVLSDDGTISRRHAEIRLTSGRHLLLDLSSSNGTWVAGRPVLQHLLEDGDVITIGDHQLRYQIG
jgi:DNA-binding SARP family transcriptional activator